MPILPRAEEIHLVNTLLFPVAILRRLLKHVGVGRGTDVRPFQQDWRG